MTRDPCRRRPPDGRVCAEKRVFVPVEAIPKRVIAGLPRRRGQEFLQPSRDRLARHRPRRAHQRLATSGSNRRPVGRLDHHPAGRQELPARPTRSSLPRKIKEAILAFRIEQRLHQGPHPRALPERDLSRPRLLRRRRGGAQLFRQVARRADRRRGGLSRRRCPRRPTTTTIRAANADGGQGAARLGDRPDARGRLHHRAEAERAMAEPLVVRRRGDDRDRGRRLSSPRRSAATLVASATASSGSTRAACRCARRSIAAAAGDRRPGAARRPDRLRPPARLARPRRPSREHARTGRRRLAELAERDGLDSWQLAGGAERRPRGRAASASPTAARVASRSPR